MEENDVYYRIISIKEDSQVRLTINNFRGTDYISLREYYLDFEEQWQPTPKGVTLPLSIPIVRELFAGLVEIMSLAEAKDILETEFKEVLDNIYDR